MPDAIRFRISAPGDLHRLTFDPARDPALTTSLTEIIGAPLPEPHRPSGTVPMLIWQGPHDMLIAGLGGKKLEVRQLLQGRAALFGDASAGLMAFHLSGGVDTRLGHDRPGAGLSSRVMRLAGLRVAALWPGEASDRVSLYVDRSHASYLAEWLADRWLALPHDETAQA